MNSVNLTVNGPESVDTAFQLDSEEKGLPSQLCEPQTLPVRLLNGELEFYRRYPWSIQVFPTVRQIQEHLRSEFEHLSEVTEEWQRKEVQINIFLFSCALTEVVDDFLLGKTCDLSKIREVIGFAGPALGAVEFMFHKRRSVREWRLQRFYAWRSAWEQAVQKFAAGLLGQQSRESEQTTVSELRRLLEVSLPDALLASRPRIPAAFHAQDLTHHDIVALGGKFIAAFPDRKRPVLIVGLRTAGSYFAPLLQAHLTHQGYEYASSVTIRPKTGVGYWESLRIRRAAKENALVAIIDEPGGTGSTYVKAVDCVRRSDIPKENVVLLLPVHPTVRNWREKPGYQRLSRFPILPLEPEEYYKNQFLTPQFAQRQLSPYFENLGYAQINVVESAEAAAINERLLELSEQKSQNRLKRVYQVELRTQSGELETRFVIGKSVGWGWLSYHAVIAGERLAGFVPSVLGLRNGFLYSEWIEGGQNEPRDRGSIIENAAAYIAARAKKLPLHDDPTPQLAEEGRHFATEKLIDFLSHAYGGRAIAGFKRPGMRRELGEHKASFPTFIDGRMRQLEWIGAAANGLKSDFEQHGLGKYELSIVDPAYDIADFSLNFRLTSEEEERLIENYRKESGDTGVRQRLFINKLQAGTWGMSSALSNLNDARLTHRHEEFHQRFTEAWNFLTLQTAHYCGGLCRHPKTIEWGPRIVFLDIDGVVDKHDLGFPSTTAAGIEALSLLHDHGLTLAIDSARSIEEVKEYCRVYGFAGGVAEYGAWIWDAVRGKELMLATEDEREQLQELSRQLRQIPGVFLNDGYKYSLRAYTYSANGTVPLPTPVIETLMNRLKLHRLKLRQTSLDTTVLPASIDKGKGLLALKALAGQQAAETFTVGDTEPDLAMFAVSQHSFAPANCNCRSLAKSIGCDVVEHRHQMGLLQIARKIVHREAKSCERCRQNNVTALRGPDWFAQLLEVADQGRMSRLLSALRDPLWWRAFTK